MSKKPTFLQRCKAAAESNAHMADLLEHRALLLRANRIVCVIEHIHTVEARMREELKRMAP